MSVKLPEPAAVFQQFTTGRFPHQAYRPVCACIAGQPEEQRNYAGHVISPPKCSVCRAPYQLDISLMSTFVPKAAQKG